MVIFQSCSGHMIDMWQTKKNHGSPFAAKNKMARHNADKHSSFFSPKVGVVVQVGHSERFHEAWDFLEGRDDLKQFLKGPVTIQGTKKLKLQGDLALMIPPFRKFGRKDWEIFWSLLMRSLISPELIFSLQKQGVIFTCVKSELRSAVKHRI